MITAQCRISNGPFSAPHTYPAEAMADGSGTIVTATDGRKFKFNKVEFDKHFSVAGQDRTTSGHKSMATATVESVNSAKELVSKLLD